MLKNLGVAVIRLAVYCALRRCIEQSAIKNNWR